MKWIPTNQKIQEIVIVNIPFAASPSFLDCFPVCLIFLVIFSKIIFFLFFQESENFKKSEKMQSQLREQQEILETVRHLHYKICLAKGPLSSMSKIHSFTQTWNPPCSSEGTPPFLGTSSFWSKFKKLPPLSESHLNWCM